MIASKFLISGVATVGTVATAAVVANQFGAFSFSSDNKSTSENSRQNSEVSEKIKKLYEWVKTTSEDRVTLKIDLLPFTEADAESLLTYLKGSQKSLFEDSNLNGATKKDKKTILFEKESGGWKHSKTEIKNWGESNKFEIKIKKGDGNPESLEQTNEEDLVGLLNYLKTNETQQLSNYKNPSGDSKASLTLKKEADWDVIHDQNTINNWVENVSSEKASLEIWEKGEKKELSSLDENSFKGLLDDLEAQKSLFEDGNLSGATKQSKKKIIFEKYESSYNGKTLSWTHIKKAIEDKLKSKVNGGELSEIKVEIKNETKESLLNNTDDNDLTGLLNYLETNSENYEISAVNNPKLTLEKDNNDTWKSSLMDS